MQDRAKVLILLVDDEEIHSRVLARAIAVEECDCKTKVARSGMEALELLEKEPVDIVVSDHLMPGMDGIQLLEKVRQLYPSTRRVLLTAYPGSDVIMEAVNRAMLHKALSKEMQGVKIIQELLELVNECLVEPPSSAR